ncbi:Pprimosomal protein N' [Candidatus Vecturithrix granuli]|uniref:Replication restart protein PriA n=1 Tax=Vecturithrix granuli TaxID=1499967 RepID=A0A081C8P4_VECG1|nr:Pprimosomal protein N' [Candidatus Vecturithrix granuli]
MQYIDVAVALPVNHLYTYRVPEDVEEQIQPGQRVLVAFGKKYLAGYVVRLAETPELEHVKDILDILDAEPIVTPNILRLTEWIAEYYCCSWGIAIKAALPTGIDILHSIRVHLRMPPESDRAMQDFFDDLPLRVSGGMQKKILAILRQSPTISLADLQKKVGKKRLHASLHALERQGLIELEDVVALGKMQAKTLQHAVLLASEILPSDLDNLENHAPNQMAVLNILRERFPDGLPIVDLQEMVKFDPRSALKALTQKGYVQTYPKEIQRRPGGYFAYQKTPPLLLTPEQRQVFEQIHAAINSNQFAPMLLHGVTGSGKTEIYMQAIAYLLTLKRRAIVLVPEISLTPLLVSRFLSRFENNVAVLHSGLSTGERYDEWLRIKRGEVDVVIGARSAIFAPMERLGLIVVDEEHEMSYKQDSEPRYHGRDTAVMRARLENIPILLGSATPSLESYYNSQTNKYQLLTIKERVDARPLPTVEIIDRRRDRSQHLFSNTLEQAIRDVLARGEQVLLFLNLRGFANFYLCQECGFVYDCPRCNVTLTYHASTHRLQCHYCDFSRLPPVACEQCGSPNVQYRGIGTERIEQDAQLLFPEAVVTRMDRDTVSGKNAHYTILRQFDQGEIDILIGTQMVTKGHDFPNVTLVGVIAAEIGLNLPDFRSSERTFQILTQVAGRTGRGHLGGHVIIQTYNPLHYAILAAQQHDYLTFYAREIVFRQQLNYPPFSRMINIVLQGEDELFTRDLAQRLCEDLRRADSRKLTVLGPAPAALTRLRNKYRYQILLKSQQSLYMRTFAKEQVELFRKTVALKDVQILVDVDPVSLL